MNNQLLTLFFSVLLLQSIVNGQINFGQFGLHNTGNGGWDLGMNQGANIFGFGGDRGFRVAGNRGGVNVEGTGGAIIGNERVGVDSGLDVQRGGLDLGSQLQFGNNPSPMHPGGQLGSFIDNIKNFFSNIVGGGSSTAFVPPPVTFMPPRGITQPPTLRPRGINTEGNFNSGGETESIGESNGNVEPMDGETATQTVDVSENKDEEESSSKTHAKGENTSEEKRLFSRTTQRPRQLPGLVEFIKRL